MIDDIIENDNIAAVIAKPVYTSSWTANTRKREGNNAHQNNAKYENDLDVEKGSFS